MSHRYFRRSAGSSLDPQTAEELLRDVFALCGREPNQTPIEILSSYRDYRQERYTLQKHILAFLLLLFLLLPLLFVPPSFSLDLSTASEPGRPVYVIAVDTFLPVTRVTAAIDGHDVFVYETGHHRYAVEPIQNGTMTVTVTLANGQYAVHDISVEGADFEAPRLISSHQKSGHLYLYFTDEGSGICYDRIYATDEDGEHVEPLSCDPENGCVEFLRPGSTMHICIPDQAGNQLQLVITIT